MKVDFNIAYPLSRLCRLHAGYRQKAALVEDQTHSKLLEVPNAFRSNYTRSSREVTRLTEGLKFCQKLLSYRRGVQDRLVSLLEQFNELAGELSNSSITEDAAKQKLKLLCGAIEGCKKYLGFYGGLPINLCLPGHIINQWDASTSPSAHAWPDPAHLKEGLETLAANLTLDSTGVTLTQKVQLASQFLLEKVLARHEEDCKFIDSTVYRIQSEIKANRSYLESFSVPKERRLLEFAEAKKALERFFTLRAAERQTWKRFEEALLRN